MNPPAFNYPSWFKVIKKYRKRFYAKFAKVDNKDTALDKKCFPFTNPQICLQM